MSKRSALFALAANAIGLAVGAAAIYAGRVDAAAVAM